MKRFSDIVNRKRKGQGEIQKRENTTGQFRICKKDTRKRRVFGYAITGTDNDIGNSQGYLIDGMDMELAIYEFIFSLPTAATSQPASVIESCVFSREKQQAIGIPPGILPPFTYWIGFEIHDPGIWEMIQQSNFPVFTIDITGNTQE